MGAEELHVRYGVAQNAQATLRPPQVPSYPPIQRIQSDETAGGIVLLPPVVLQIPPMLPPVDRRSRSVPSRVVPSRVERKIQKAKQQMKRMPQQVSQTNPSGSSPYRKRIQRNMIQVGKANPL